VRAITAVGPHPAGSEANKRVREYLVEQLGQLAMAPRVIEGTAFARREGRERTVHNIVARLRGTEGGPGVMLAAHYDSVPAGPGAGDDAAAVGALLETCRAVRGLRRDVILVLTDGEELGLVGARSLFASDAKMLRQAVADPRNDIGVVMNFEARGTAGPSLMFETGAGNLNVIREFAKADPYPYANSLSYDVYRMLPNDTDFSVFRRPVHMGGGDLQGLNFAFISNYFWYHSKSDTPENLQAASVYHHGMHALSMASRFGNMTAAELRAIRNPTGPNAVYYNLTRGMLAWYPGTWVWPLVIVQGVLAACGIVVGFRRGMMTGGGFFGGVARLVLALGITPAAVYGLRRVMGSAGTPGAFWGQLAAVAGSAVFVTAMVTLVPVRFSRRAAPGVRGSHVGGFAGVVLVFLLVLSVASALYVPGGGFLVVWPGILLALGVILGAMRAREVEEDEDEMVDEDPGRRSSRLRSRRSAPAWTGVVVVLVAVPAVVLWGPILVQLFTALTMGMAWACSIGVAIATAIVVAGFTPLAVAGGGTGGRPGARRIDPA
jgi:hypothetical protein